MKPRKTPPTKGLVAVAMHGLLCFFILWLGGIGKVVQQVLKVHAHLLKFTLSCILVIGGERGWGLEVGIIQSEELIQELAETPPSNPRNVIFDRDACTTNSIPVLVVELPEIHGMLFAGLGPKIPQSALERPSTINSFSTLPEAMPEPKANKPGKETRKNTLEEYVHSVNWCSVIVTSAVCFVIGFIVGRFRVEIGWWIGRKHYLHNVYVLAIRPA
jgi:hypothetical protein